MTNLKSARQNSKIEDFIAEHKADPDGDLDKLDAVISRPSPGTGKAVPKASIPASSVD
ncbi:MAG: hypothetical protein ACI8R4_001822 [Paracoccaceae bacterium]|jgi:hypothetical protein